MTQALIHTDRGNRSATISECGRYRYALERATGMPGFNLTWLMLNPSTADADADDPTIRKVVGFTRRAGFGVALVVNLFAYRATDPKDCRAHLHEAEGEWNRKAIIDAADISNAVVCAWGATPWAEPQAKRVLEWLKGYKLLCLGKTKSGAPLHPLMPSYDGHPLVPFRATYGPVSQRQSDTILWCVRVLGPDDLHAMPDYATAEKNVADLVAALFTERTASLDVLCLPVVAVWPYSPKAHREDLKRRAQVRFHDHLDICKRCREQPFNLCAVGDLLLRRTGIDEALAQSGPRQSADGSEK